MITLCLILTELNFPQTQAGDMDENKKNSHNALAIKISTDQRSVCKFSPCVEERHNVVVNSQTAKLNIKQRQYNLQNQAISQSINYSETF